MKVVEVLERRLTITTFFVAFYASPLARSTDASTSVEMLDRAPFPARTPPPPPDKPPPRPQHSSFLLQRAASASSLHPARASHRATLKPPEPELWSKEPTATGTATEGYGWADQLSEQERALKHCFLARARAISAVRVSLDSLS